MAAYALDGQVEAIGDAAGASAGLVDRPLAVDLIAGPEDHSADRVGDRVLRASMSAGGSWAMIACMSGRRVKVGSTESLVGTNLPKSESWTRAYGVWLRGMSRHPLPSSNPIIVARDRIEGLDLVARRWAVPRSWRPAQRDGDEDEAKFVTHHAASWRSRVVLTRRS